MERLELGFSQPECSALTTTLWDTPTNLQIEMLNGKQKVLKVGYSVVRTWQISS